MVGRQNAEIAGATPEGIKRRKRSALLEIVLVRQHTAFRTAAGARGIDDGSDVVALTQNKRRFSRAAEFLPTIRLIEICIRRRFGDENSLQICCCTAAGSRAELPPYGIFGDEHSGTRVLEQLPLLIGREFVI